MTWLSPPETVTLVFFAWGVTNGNWSDFVSQWQSDRFINVMSLDFCTLSFLLPLVLVDDTKRRGLEHSGYKWLAILFPLFGSLIYWCWRPQLPVQQIIEKPIMASVEDQNQITKVS